MREERSIFKKMRPLVLASLALLSLSLCLFGIKAYATALPSGPAPYSDHIVNGVSPNGTTIDLFDYWITAQTDADNSNGAGTDFISQGINSGHALLFGNGLGDYNNKNGAKWFGDWNVWTGNASPKTGIVNRQLGDDGYPVLNVSVNSASQLSSRNGSESLAYLFDPDTSSVGKASYEDVQGLLQVDSAGYYYYDSQDNYAVYYQNSDSFVLYDLPGVLPGGNSPVGQFFPFNEATSNGESFSYSNQWYNLMNGDSSTNTSLNHYFGIHMSTRFIQQDGGHTDETRKNAVTYEFSGDDDVWIFIDGVLVVDLGGIHNAASVSINFATGAITINGVQQDQTLGNILGTGSATLADNTYHTLDFFYLERGNVDSNMNLKYNLVTIPESDLIKVDQLGVPVEGAEFALYAAGDYATEGTMATPVATGTTDSAGEFVFLRTDNAGNSYPITIDELYKSYGNSKDDAGNNLVLVETKTPEGYRSVGEVGLYFYRSEATEEVLLLSNSIWDKGAYAMPKVTTTTDNTIQLLNDANDVTGTDVYKTVNLVGSSAVENPVMFAVVFRKQDKGDWHPVSGDPIDGWTVWENSSWDSVLGAAQDSTYLFRLASSGAYQVEISNLPGDIKTYYHICKNEDTAQYTIAYYYTEADTLAEATASNTWRINAESTDYSLDRVFSMDLYVTNIKNYLLVQKVDDAGNTVNGASFSLYKADDVTVTDDGTVTVNVNAAAYDSLTTETVTGILNLDGGGIFPTNGHVLELGEYYLIETSAPTGYKLNDTAVHVIVDDTGVYADAGTADDGITVLRGVGSVMRSMVQFAVDDGVDTTLQGIKAALASNVTYTDSSFTWDKANWDEDTGTILHLQYANSNSMLDYGLYDTFISGTIDNLTLATEGGWSKLLIQQCYRHNNTVDTSLKSNLEETDITSLFSGTVTVRVANDRTGNLTISKTVAGEDAPQDSEFSFTVTVKDGGTPLSGTYDTTNSLGASDSIAFVDGSATVTLKGGEDLTILGLPTGTVYSVTEASVSGYKTEVAVTGDENYTVNGATASGTIGQTPNDVTVAYTNTWSSVDLSVSKTVTGSMGDRDREFDFTIELKDSEGNPLSGSYSYMRSTLEGATGVDVPADRTLDLDTEGKATFSLKHGQVITISGLPAGCTYTITEGIEASEGYQTTVQIGSEGPIPAASATGTLSDTLTVAFTNSRESTPATGVIVDVLPWVAAGAAAFGGGGALVATSRRRPSGKHFARSNRKWPRR